MKTADPKAPRFATPEQGVFPTEFGSCRMLAILGVSFVPDVLCSSLMGSVLVPAAN